MHERGARAGTAPAPFAGQEAGPVAASSGRREAWGVILAAAAVIVSTIPFTAPTDPLETAGRATPRALIEFALLTFGVLLAARIFIREGRGLRFWTSPPFVLATVFSAWAVCTAAWSPGPMLSIVKSVELWLTVLAAALLAVTALRTGQSPGRWLAIALLSVIGGLLVLNLVIWGTPLPLVSPDDPGFSWQDAVLVGEGPAPSTRPRLVLAYAYPLVAADLIGLAILAVIAAPPSRRILIMLAPCLAVLLWMTDGRAPTAGTVVALGTLAVLRMRNGPRVALLAVAALAALGVPLLHAFGYTVSALQAEDVSTLNGRTELWAESLPLILQRPLGGWGYFATRYPLLEQFSWAGHAHNWAIELLLGTGLVGFLLGVPLVFYAFGKFGQERRLLAAVTVYGLIHGMFDPVLFVPGPPMFMWMCLLVHAALARLRPPLSARREGYRWNVPVVSWP